MYGPKRNAIGMDLWLYVKNIDASKDNEWLLKEFGISNVCIPGQPRNAANYDFQKMKVESLTRGESFSVSGMLCKQGVSGRPIAHQCCDRHQPFPISGCGGDTKANAKFIACSGGWSRRLETSWFIFISFRSLLYVLS